MLSRSKAGNRCLGWTEKEDSVEVAVCVSNYPISVAHCNVSICHWHQTSLREISPLICQLPMPNRSSLESWTQWLEPLLLVNLLLSYTNIVGFHVSHICQHLHLNVYLVWLQHHRSTYQISTGFSFFLTITQDIGVRQHSWHSNQSDSTAGGHHTSWSLWH